MALLEVLTWPDPRLLEVAQDVPEMNDEVRRFAADLTETMYSAGGVGLAATQVGTPWRVVVVDCTSAEEERRPLVLTNARITRREGSIIWREGCLSLPGVTAEVERSAQIVVEFLDQDGDLCRLETEGLEAVCIQHELDHLDGQLYVDRLGQLERAATLLAYDEARTQAADPEAHEAVEVQVEEEAPLS